MTGSDGHATANGSARGRPGAGEHVRPGPVDPDGGREPEDGFEGTENSPLDWLLDRTVVYDDQVTVSDDDDGEPETMERT
jgi:hypothetical protein